MNEIFLASSLLDYLCKNPQAGPKEILINNPFGFSKRDDYQTKQPWRRDWQANLLWVMENDQIFGKTAQYHKGSDCFHLYANAYVSGAIPLNDYRFDFICNGSLRNELEKFYESVQATVQGMTINDSFTHSTIVESNDGRKRHLYCYPDHIAVSYEENGIWSSQKDVKFHDIAGKSILDPEELKLRATEFFETIKNAIQSCGA